MLTLPSYRAYGVPQPPHAAPFLLCHTRFVPQRAQMSNLFTLAPQFWHRYFRLPPLAVFSIRSPHRGHAFWSCFMASRSCTYRFCYQILLNSTTR